MPGFKEKTYAEAAEAEPGGELTEAEMETLRRAVETIRTTRGSSDEANKAICDAGHAIAAIGRKALPHLRELLSADFHRYTVFADALAEKEDLGALLDDLGQETVLCNSDGSSASRLSKALIRALIEIRDADPEDPRLRQASESLIRMCETPGLNHLSVQHDIFVALSCTGTPEAKDYIAARVPNLHPDRAASYQRNLADPTAATGVYLERPELVSWDTILRRRQRSQNAADRSGSMRFEIERVPENLPDDLGSFEMPTVHVEYEGADAEEEAVAEPDPAIVNLESEQAESAYGSTESRLGLAKTAKLAVRLHMFNYLHAHPGASGADIEAELDRCKRLSDIEDAAKSEANPLPTIGIEVEMPDVYSARMQRARRILSALGIPVHHEDEDLLETNPSFSYSALVQARFIQELAKMGAIPLDRREDGKLGRVQRRETISMHVNFGIPAEIDESMLDDAEDEIYLVNDLLIAAFTSPQRILMRKTSTSATWNQPAEKSEKNRPSGDMAGRRLPKYRRLELRAFEFKDYPSYRLLIESQRIVAMLVAHLKAVNLLPVTEKEKKLAGLWDEFAVDVPGYFLEIGHGSNMADDASAELQDMMESTALAERCRLLAGSYSRRIAAIVRQGEGENAASMAA